ncbi:retrovirus-related pol polyprotein from transposon TNT 1-94 [Tanacetum coccineum]|uniref:Retrovirus-related pol polyprotein from transposon TNT 1-94 n=1 Tax=Tanacetum coccineum TaxID=301880 RepID=A0ABQ5A5J9_9ASTR
MTDEQNPQQPPPPTQQDQLESPESPITYDPASQVDYNPDQINIKPNNEVALLYPKHNNSDYFLVVSDFIFKSDKMEPEGTNLGAKSGRRKQIPVTMKERVIGKVKANPQLSSVKSAPNHEPVFLASIIIHYESASGHDALADSTTEADPGKSDPKDLLSQQQEFDASPEFTTSSDEVNDEIKLEDLRELLKDKSNEPIDLDTPEDDQPFLVVSENKEEIQTEAYAKTEDTSSQNIKMEKEKEVAFISAQPSFPNVQHLIKLLVKSLKPELSQLLTGHDFSSSIPTKLKELPSKISDINGAVGEIKKYVEELEVKTPGDLKDLLGKFATAIEIASQKACDTSVPSTGQAGTHPAEGEKYTNQATITQLFQKRLKKDASKWCERSMNYLKEKTDCEAMINSIKNGDHPLPVVAQVSLAGTTSNVPPPLKDKSMWTAEEKKNRKIDRLARSLLIQGLPNDIYSLIDSNEFAKELWDALKRHMLSSEYGEQDRKATVLYEYETFKDTEGEMLLDTYIRYLQVINILKKCGYNKDNSMGYKKKAVVVTSDPLALVAKKTKISKGREKVVVQSESEGSDDKDISNLKKITELLANAFNQKKYDAKATNNNLRTSPVSTSANKKPEYVKSEEKKEDKKYDGKKQDMSKVKFYNCKKEGHFDKDCKKAKVKDYNYYKTKMLLAKKDSDEQVLLAKDQAWMESSSDFDQEISANMVFMAKMEKILSDSEESSSSAKEIIAEVSYYSSNSGSDFEYETSDYYDNSTNYGLFVDNDDDQEIYHDAIETASENFDENHGVSQKDHDESEVDHNESEDKDELINKLIAKFNHKIAICQKRIEKVNQQRTDLENQNKALQDKNDVLNNQVNIIEEKSNEFDVQIRVLKENNDDLLAQTKILQDQLKVKHVVDTHTECQAQYAKLEEERYQYMIRYSALYDNDKQHRKKIDEQEI